MKFEAVPESRSGSPRSYWRRRGLVRLGDGSGRGSGSGSGPRPWAMRIRGIVRRARSQPPSPSRAAAVARAPLRLLGRMRDAYVDAMLGAAKTRPASEIQKPEELGHRLIMEMYKSVLASSDPSGMLRASVAR